MFLDDVTPREVWAEYSRRKAELLELDVYGYLAALDQLELELGIGLPPQHLTALQLEAQRAAIARHGGTECTP